MKKSNSSSPEFRERAVRLEQEHQGDCSALLAAIESIALKIGCVAQLLQNSAQQAEADTGARTGATTAEQDRVKVLDRELKQLRCAKC